MQRMLWRALLLTATLLPTADLAAKGEPKGELLPKYTDVKFTSGGQEIKVWQYVPAEGKGPFPAIVLLHGIDGLDLLQKDVKVQLLYRTIASRMAQKGYVVHFIHYFQRTPMKDEQAAKVKEAFLQLARGTTDKIDPKYETYYTDWMAAVRDGIAFLRQHKDVDPARLGLVGLSMGGFVATSLVVDYPELKVAALANIFGGLPQQQYDKVRKGKLKLPPLFIVGGEEDDIVPERYQRELFLLWRETGNPGEAHFYGGVGHAFFDKTLGTFDQNLALNEALPTTQRFLKRHLEPRPAKK